MAAISLDHVGVHFMLSEHKRAGLLRTMHSFATGGALERRHGKVGVSALHDVSLALADGDRLALIGHNGAGKSTLLRVLAGILPPTSGRLHIEGRISALLSIQVGISGNATGRDNIRIRSRYMGVTEREIDSRFDEIAEFCELGDYLDLPVRTYSSGMRLRLAFAIATAFQPEILIMDEWLSAGDEQFRNKAANRLNHLIERTGIFAFASHSESLQRRVCNKGLVLKHGRLVFFGALDEAIDVHKALITK